MFIGIKGKLRIIYIGLIVIISTMIWNLDAQSWIGQNIGAQASASISLGTTVVGEGDDFATRVLGLPWDMVIGPQPDFPTALAGIDRGSFSTSSGIWDMTTVGNDPSIWLLPSGINDTQEILKLGDRYPIDSSFYDLLSFYLCSDSSGTSNILWFLDQSPHSQFAESYFIGINAACTLYVVDLNEIGVLGSHGGVTDWAGQIKGLRLDPISQSTGVGLQLDWVRLTTGDTTNIVPINWSDISSGTELHFYLNTSCTSTSAIPVGTMLRGGVTSGTFQWGSTLQPNLSIKQPYPLPESFQPGEYTVLMRVDGSGSPICASVPLEIRQAPILDFKKPSKISGPDYAADVVGDPWGMSNSGDIFFEANISGSSFNSGVYDATNINGDPSLHLNVLSNVNTNDYKYVTFRFKLDGTQDIGGGWVGRIVWWYIGPGIDAAVTEDMLLYEDWQTYTMNLDEVLFEPSNPGSWSGSPIVFRIDPHEISTPNDFHLDYVLLTGDEQVTAGSPFTIVYDVTPSSGLSLTFYYDTDTDPTNGRTLMQAYSGPAPPLSPNDVFIPLVNNASSEAEIELIDGLHWVWDTSGVSAGTYYVSSTAADGVNITTWYSEIPVIITN